VHTTLVKMWSICGQRKRLTLCRWYHSHLDTITTLSVFCLCSLYHCVIQKCAFLPFWHACTPQLHMEPNQSQLLVLLVLPTLPNEIEARPGPTPVDLPAQHAYCINSTLEIRTHFLLSTPMSFLRAAICGPSQMSNPKCTLLWLEIVWHHQLIK
jgi:hypothetical protein